MRTLFAFAASALLLSACNKSSTPAPQPAPAGQPAAEGSAAPAPGGADTTAAPSSPEAYVTTVVVLKVEPVDSNRIKKPDGKETSNYRALLYRGEQVTVLETNEDWVRVRTSDEKEGWLKRSWVLEAAGVKEATFTAAEKVFDRPDLLASNAKKKLEAGTFVLVVKEKPPFSEVNYSGGQNTWVLTERLATDPKDVGAAKLIEKARYLAKNNKKDEALATLEIVKTIAPESPLYKTLATELGVETEVATDAEPTVQPASTTEEAPSSDSASEEGD